jgi:hypothetical protein
MCMPFILQNVIDCYQSYLWGLRRLLCTALCTQAGIAQPRRLPLLCLVYVGPWSLSTSFLGCHNSVSAS